MASYLLHLHLVFLVGRKDQLVHLTQLLHQDLEIPGLLEDLYEIIGSGDLILYVYDLGTFIIKRHPHFFSLYYTILI